MVCDVPCEKNYVDYDCIWGSGVFSDCFSYYTARSPAPYRTTAADHDQNRSQSARTHGLPWVLENTWLELHRDRSWRSKDRACALASHKMSQLRATKMRLDPNRDGVDYSCGLKPDQL